MTAAHSDINQDCDLGFIWCDIECKNVEISDYVITFVVIVVYVTKQMHFLTSQLVLLSIWARTNIE